jgi:acyl-coenzyme A synthetase/AMP-(fatty) acid ligase
MRAFLNPTSDDVALVEAATGRTWTHAELDRDVAALAERLAGPRSLVLCRTGLTSGTVIGYLAALAAGHAVLLVDDGTPEPAFADLLGRYEPRFVVDPAGALQERDVAADPAPHPDLAVLLSTSGTTGSPKLVRLSAGGVEANARAIAEYLGLGPGERAVASLPLHYCYGLSVLNSHLVAGGAVVLPPGGLLHAGFWPAVAEHRCTSFAGVPYSYALLKTTGWARRELPALRTLTQAGGRMPPQDTLDLARTLRDRGGRLVVMYGQTEATARMAWLPPDRLEDKLGAAGVAIPGGHLDVDPTGEVLFTGPNVMLGYAEQRADLALGDVLGGVLRTGDTGRLDDEGFLFLDGRRGRFAKLYGLRVSLEDVEQAVGHPAAALERDDRALTVFVQDADPAEVRLALARRLALPPRTFDVRLLDALPLTPNGKVDYVALRAESTAPAGVRAST